MRKKWQTLVLGDICTMKYGKMPKKEDLVEEGYPVFSGYRVVGHHKKFLYKDSEIVVIARGVGGCGDVTLSPPYSWVTNLSIVLQLTDKLVDKKFLFYRLLSTTVRSLNTGSAQPQVIIADLKEYRVQLPPLPTQRKIAGILSAYDDFIENNNRRIEILEEMARMLYREWFFKFRYPGHESDRFVESELGLIPQGWEVVKLGSYIKTQKGYAFKSIWYQEEGRKIVKVSNFTDDSISADNLVCVSEDVAKKYQKHQLSTDDIIVQTVGSWASNPSSVVGKVIKVPPTVNRALLNQNSVKVKPQKPLSQEFLFYSIKNERFKSHVIGCAQGAASQASITLEVIKDFKVLMPPQKYINLFREVIKPIWNLTSNLTLKNNNLRQTRDLLLPRLISGEIDVENLDIKVVNN